MLIWLMVHCMLVTIGKGMCVMDWQDLGLMSATVIVQQHTLDAKSVVKARLVQKFSTLPH